MTFFENEYRCVKLVHKWFNTIYIERNFSETHRKASLPSLCKSMIPVSAHMQVYYVLMSKGNCCQCQEERLWRLSLIVRIVQSGAISINLCLSLHYLSVQFACQSFCFLNTIKVCLHREKANTKEKLFRLGHGYKTEFAFTFAFSKCKLTIRFDNFRVNIYGDILTNTRNILTCGVCLLAFLWCNVL